MKPVASVEEIESRLRALPAATSLTASDERALLRLERFDLAFAEVGRRGARSTPRLRFATVAAAIVGALLVILLVNTTGAYFAPRYARILADTPGIGPISGRYLQAVGLSGADVTLVGDSSTSAGHTLKLVAAYADGLRTVLFVSIDGKGLPADPKQFGLHPGDWGLSYDDVTLTDQFGHSYAGWGVGGPTALQFQPLVWPASAVGARLTLHVTGLWAMWKGAALGPGASFDPETVTVHGDWNLHATVVAEPSHPIALPEPVQSDGAVYTFTSVTASHATLVVHLTISGPITREIKSSATPDALLGLFSPRVFDAEGREMQLQDYGSEVPRNGGPVSAEMTAFITGPGRYRIVLAAALSAPDQQRWIVVP